jgi:hypothetical protein
LFGKYTYASYGAGGSRKEIAGITAMSMICTYRHENHQGVQGFFKRNWWMTSR